MNSLDPIDIGAFAFVAVHALLGFTRGLVWQVVRVLALAAALTVSRLLQPGVSDWLRSVFPTLADRLVAPVAYFGVFTVVFAVGTSIAWVLRRAIGALQLTGIDRVLGAVLGLAKGAVWVILVLIAAAHLDLSSELRARVASTHAAAAAERAIEVVAPFFPEEIRERVASSLDGLSVPGRGR